MKTALNVDVTGQDSAYLAQFLLRFGYKVYDTHRPTIENAPWGLPLSSGR
jgi:GDP-D-mannose dehydratase